MKNVINIFSWIASALVEGISPGCFVMDNILDGLKKYGESVTKIAEAMQRAWLESIRTLKIALGENTLLSPKSRKQIAEKFAKEVITPFGVKHELTGKRLDAFCKKALEQCYAIENISQKIMDFTEYDEDTLLENLTNIDKFAASSEEIGEVIIHNIQNQVPQAKELIELLWFRNLLMEGIVAHFSLELSYNPNLSAIVSRLDRNRIQKDLDDIKQQISYAMEHRNFSELTTLGAQATRLSTIDQVCNLNEKYQNLLGPVMYKLDQLSEDHENINAKLDDILKMFAQLQDMQKGRHNLNSTLIVKPGSSEEQLVENLNSYVEIVGWEKLPQEYRIQTVHLLATSLYDLNKLPESISLLKKLIDNGAKDAQIYFTYFEMLQVSHQYQQAIEIYNIAIELDPRLALFPCDKYNVIDIIAKGRTGFVYRVLDVTNDMIVAIKVFKKESFYKKDFFFKAIETISDLDYSDIIKVYEVSKSQEKYLWVAMENVKGDSLQQKIQKHGLLSFDDTLDLAFKIGEALGYAHQNNIIHGDLKPANIFCDGQNIKIGDFGLAEWKNSLLVTTNDIYASIYYSAPEKFLDASELSVQSDIYSFAKTLYYLLTGNEPHDIDWDDISENMRHIIKKATRKVPEKRYSSIEEMLIDIQKVKENGNSYVEETVPESGIFPVFYVRNKAINILPQFLLDHLPSGYKVVGQEIISPIDQVPMVYVPSGTFLMGDDSIDAELEEEPKHSVCLSAYLIDKYPITNNSYRMFLEAIAQNPQENIVIDEKKKLHIPQFWYHPKWNLPNHPVVGVDWTDVQAYCTWAEKSLPTEAEWEKAARGSDERYYPWGNESPYLNYCNYNNTTGGTSPVNFYQKNVSPYGCCDMAGNVWEWCQDWYDPHYYHKSPFNNPQGCKISNFKVARGGSWKKSSRRVRTTTRGYASLNERKKHIGFRTVKRINKC